ncbi:TonB-dependent receptor [Terrimonas sp.]|uniref:SusC/RagA family TonB-linked outer membrane protein n=1 Tax=Terrimonas sp. TaxID=1914338 RepID=UPI000D51F8A4|nr:TonB-dependent receptor [Terrimonas sp.]PVD53283.1 TonB-dependent receptor [Terrimonas sp.]
MLAKLKHAKGVALVLCMLLSGNFLFAQGKKISGKVTNSASGQPIQGATINIKGSTTGTVSDAEGAFSITVPNEKSVLIITSVGFDPIEISAEGRDMISVGLKEKQGSLEEVVVTGYTSQKKKDLTGAVSVVDVSQMKAQPVASPVEALQGKATGVHIINDGAPGSTPQIRIRGFSTINNNDPLFVIDGVPFEGKLSWLNQNDIESMQVLKDASAASIYGARANNGVVIITTKKGKNGAPPRVTFDTYVGTQVPRRETFPKMMNPSQFADYVYASFNNLNDPAQAPGKGSTTGTNYGTGSTPVLPEYLLAGTKTGHDVTATDADMSKYNYTRDASKFYQITKANQQGTDWFREITTTAPMQNYMLSVSGGGQSSNYAVSGSYMNQQGTVKYTGFERYTFRANTNFSMFDNRVRVGENFQFARTRSNGVGVNVNTSGDYQGEGSALGFAYRIQTIIPVYDEGGNFAGTRGDKLGNAQNPMAILYRAKDNYTMSNTLLGNVYAEVDILKGLVLRTSFGLRYENWNSFSASYPNPEHSEGSITSNSMSENYGFNNDWTWTNTLNYKRSFGKHGLNLLAGTEAIKTKYRYLSGGRNDFFILGNLDYYYLDAGSSNISNSSNGSLSSLYSLFGKVEYNYDSKYILTGTLRRDGSSNFGPEHKYGTFPAIGAAWRISGENFMESVSWINDLKLRVGYGVTGNQRIPAFNYLPRYSSSQAASYYPITGSLVSGVWQSNYDNPAIKWEELSSLNVGLDFSLLNNTIDGSFEWYNRDTKDMLYPVPQPSAAVGQGSAPFINVGTMNNKGVELTLNYHYNKPNANNFTFDFGVNFSKNINEVTYLAPSVPEQPYLGYRNLTVSILKPGQPFGAFYGYKMIGIYQDASELASGYTGARIGGPKYADVSGPDGKPDGIINAFDRTIIGSPHPDFIYSFSLNATFKNFDVVMFFNGSQGNDLYEVTRQFTDFGLFGGAISTRLLDAWSPTNKDSNIPSPYANRAAFEMNSNSYYVQDGSFFRMRNLQIGYTFGEKVLGNYIKSLRAYVSATNLFTITKYSGMDPEVSQLSSTFSAPGVDSGIYPVSRQYLVGLSVTF